jgi:hypothetical protein
MAWTGPSILSPYWCEAFRWGFAGEGVTQSLFLDPDTGVNNRGSARHVSIERLACEASENELVFSFDQSFSRQFKQGGVMASKFAELNGRGCHGMYYDSHARFLFVSRKAQSLMQLRRCRSSTAESIVPKKHRSATNMILGEKDKREQIESWSAS